MAGFGDLLHLLSYAMRTPLGPAALTYFGAEQQQGADKEAREKTEARYNEALAILQRSFGDILGRAGQPGRLDRQAAQEQRFLGAERSRAAETGGELANRFGAARSQGLQDLLSLIGGQNREVNAGYQNRLESALGDLEGLGSQARRDLNRSATESRGAAISNLRARGLGASSLVGGAYRGAERERTDALARLEEQLRRERIGIRADLSGQGLAAMQQGNANLANAQGVYGQQNLAANEQLRLALMGMDQQFGNLLYQNMAGNNATRLNLMRQLPGDIVNLMAMRNDIPPSPNSLLQAAQAIGQGSAQKPDQPGWWDQNGGQVVGTSIATLLPLLFSDRELKENIEPLDNEAVLETVRTVPVSEWSYKNSQDRHIGPMAQDFRQAFGLGKDDRTIFPTDVAGVLMVAVQGLADRIDKLTARLEQMEV